MTSGTIFYVGSEQEVTHHARPLMQRIPIRIAGPDETLEHAAPGDLAIFYTEHFERFRTVIRQLIQRNVATLYAIDGILEWRNAWENQPHELAIPWTMRPVLCHRVACIGNSQARTLADWGNANKLDVVGIPRLDGLMHEKKHPETREPVIDILVMTAKCPYFTDSQREQVTQSLSDLKRWFDDNTDRFRPIWRLTAGLDSCIEVQNNLGDTCGSDLIDELQRVDATITTPSTAQLESMLMRKPTAVLDYTNSPAYVDAAWRITSGEHMDAVLRGLADASAERMQFQDDVMHDALQLETPATDRMLLLIEQMRDIALRQAQRDERIRFPETLLPDLKRGRSRWNLKEVFANSDEINAAECIDADIELADAKRTIKLLQHDIDILQKKLERAYGVFDQINAHPIAGPVLRTREKIQAWLSKHPKDEGNTED